MNGPSPSAGAKRRAETIPSTEVICARCVSLYQLWYSSTRSGETGIVSTYMIPLGMLTAPLCARPLCARPRLDLEEAAGVDTELLSGDVAGGVTGEEQHGLADVLGFDVGNRHALYHREDDFGVFAGGIGQ